jgi:DNA-binding transcriptional ArsR family regulator
MVKMVKEVPLSEITLRRYEKPYEMSHRELIRKVCLSLGLLQPGDSRDIIVDIFLALEGSKKKKEWLSSFQIRDMVEDLRKSNSLEVKGLAESNIRRQLKRLRDAMLVDKQENQYRISEFASLSELFTNKIEKFLIPQSIERVKEYLSRLDLIPNPQS